MGALAENSLLQVLVLACLVGAALLHLGHTKVPAILPAVGQVQEVVFAIVGFVIRLAPAAHGPLSIDNGQCPMGG